MLSSMCLATTYMLVSSFPDILKPDGRNVYTYSVLKLDGNLKPGRQEEELLNKLIKANPTKNSNILVEIHCLTRS